MIIKLANLLQEYGEFLEPKNKQYRSLLKNIEASSESIFSGEYELNYEFIKKHVDMLPLAENAVYESKEKFVSVVEAVASLPKIEKNFNYAKKTMSIELKIFIDNLDKTISVIEKLSRLSLSLFQKIEK